MTSNIRIQVNITGGILEFYPECPRESIVFLDEPKTVATVIAEMGINPRIILFAVIDDKIFDKTHVIKNNCTLNLFSPPAGG